MDPSTGPKSTSATHDEDMGFKENGHLPAMRDDLPEGYFPQTEEEKQLNRSLNRKLDMVLLPALSFLYMFNGLDRGNIGNAQTQGKGVLPDVSARSSSLPRSAKKKFVLGFAQDIGTTDNDVNNAVSLFYVTFVIFQPISSACGRLVGPTYWMPFLMSTWGILTLCNAFIHGRSQLIALRLLIGLFEAGFYPTVLFYLSTFYTRFDLATRIGVFYGQYAIAGAFSGAIAYGIFQLKGALHDWQYLFIIEGSLTVFVALLAFLLLPKEPGSAWFLSAAEREYAVQRIRIDNERYVLKEYGATNTGEVSQRLTKRDIIETAKDWKLWSVLICNICASVPSQAFSVFLPVVVQGMGYRSNQANLSSCLPPQMSVPPFVCGAVGLYVVAFSSDHFKERGYHTISGLMVCLIGLIMVITIEQDKGRYAALCILLLGSYITPSLTMAWLSGNTPAPGKRSLVIGVNGFGNLAGVIGSQLFRSQYGPTYLVPLHATLGFIAFSLVGYTAYRFTLHAVNKYRIRKMSTWSELDIENERDNEVRLGDKKYTFIYSL
ncbi:hypothetical protein N7510_001619 [Penicillium lagena]|uniref:uncharacterized protein n=1 Tax=Penicillium lagena TaxID=94218 RepID=UPI00254232D2|nr:uncharacterized protein N7510_001619 [Penicillium lagena]KAJ5625310.1 hypothetical protein N7510_001619 [Penicillium lagena]